ncbi:MAG: acyl-CoA desaturase [Gammaproteobacteria bacterium]|nr:acyl-CoA desaturase [Gammaproteobacteria bacterium]
MNSKINSDQPVVSVLRSLKSWLLNDEAFYSKTEDGDFNNLDYFRLSVFVLIHLGCLGVFFVGFSWVAVAVAAGLYLLRMFFITAFYHRYFSHKSFSVSRPMQFAMAVAGCTAGQRGPLWWASHHREHHITSDTQADPHSPKYGFLNSHTLWFLKSSNFPMRKERIKDMLKFPELTFLERIDWLPFIALAGFCLLFGYSINKFYPYLGTSAMQMLVWGFFVSTVVLYHATYTINSLCHRFGHRRFDTNDDSRNNFLLALLTLGEGWHNNHHRYPISTRQGFHWWEIDFSYFILWLMSAIGLVHNMRPVPVQVMLEASERKSL